jgi:CrcB protein
VEVSLIRDAFWVGLGAVFGANLRFAISRWAMKNVSASLPYGTLFINVTGSFILGFFLAWTSDRVLADPRWRALIAVGFCGGYTTFSSYAFETYTLMGQGNYSMAFANFVANNLIGFLAVMAGVALARAV